MALRNTVLLLLLTCAAIVTAARPAAAQDLEPAARPRIDFRALNFDGLPAAAPRVAKDVPAGEEAKPKKGPSIVMASLYTATALAQALDAHSTMAALHSGATERNPMMRALTSHPPAFIAMKTGTAVGLIFAGRSVAKKSRKQAIIVLAAIDAAYFAIAAHNYHVAGRVK